MRGRCAGKLLKEPAALLFYTAIGNETVPIQLAQCRFPGLAISDAKILTYFSNKNIRKQFCQTALGNCYGLKLPTC